MTERHLTKTSVSVILEKDGKVFFLRRQNTGWADGLLAFPAGHVDKGDTVLQTAVKEVREEAGVEIIEQDLEFVHVNYLLDEYVNFYFRVYVWKDTPHVGELHLASDAVWIPKDNVPEDIIPQDKKLLIYMADRTFFSERTREGGL